MNKIAFVIGNGTSRKGFDLRELNPYGTVYGCNLLLLEYETDNHGPEIPEEELDRFLLDLKKEGKFSGHKFAEIVVPHISVSMEEYRKAQHVTLGVPEDRKIAADGEMLLEDADYHNGAVHRPRSNAGMICMQDAIDRGATHIYLLGMDFIFDDDQSTSNMFSGKASTRASYTDTLNRLRYFDWFCGQKHPTISFRFVVPKNFGRPMRKLAATNVDGTYYEVLDSQLKELTTDLNE